MSLALFIAIAIGSITGSVVGGLLRGTGFGVLGNILLGIVGASITALTGLGLIHRLDSWAVATAIGAVTLLLVAFFIKRLLSLARTL